MKPKKLNKDLFLRENLTMEDIKAFQQRYKDNPVLFAQEILLIEPDDNQVTILNAIRDGDYVICHRQQVAENGQLVIALLEDNQATLKRFYKEPSHVCLMPANDAFEPIFSRDCRIEAVVLGLIRRM